MILTSGSVDLSHSQQKSIFFPSTFSPMEEEARSIVPLFTLQTSFLALLLAYLFGYFHLFRHWESFSRPYATSCFTSLAHGTPALIMAARAILTQPHNHPSGFSAPNSALQNSILEFSTAYFLIDLSHYLIFFPQDLLFIIHHVATLFVLLTCRYVVQHGAHAILGILVLAEITSPCQNTWSIARVHKDRSKIAERFYGYMSPKFYAFYSIVRGGLAPVYVYDLVLFYFSGECEGLIPRWARVSWSIITVVGIMVSWLWVYNKWSIWNKERNCSVQKKI